LEKATKAAMKMSCLWAFPALFRMLLPSMEALFSGGATGRHEPPSKDYHWQKTMLNVQIIASKPLTIWRELDIIQLVSIRSLAPGHDMNAEGTDHTLASNARALK
jgi:hypothetical protein